MSKREISSTLKNLKVEVMGLNRFSFLFSCIKYCTSAAIHWALFTRSSSFEFMQRASQKEAKKSNNKEVEVTPAGDFPSTSAALKRCVVIVEGDPHPGAARGRMSFLSFNPSIDKLNGEESGPSEKESFAANSGRQSETTSDRENGQASDKLDNFESSTSSGDLNGDLKRKQADVELEPSYAKKSKKGSKNSSPNSSHSSQKQRKHVKLDWNVLRPPIYPNKTR